MSVTSSQPEWEAVRREQLAHDLVHAALSYARRGWRVFPCVPGGKQPVGGHGFLDATVDPDRIVRWWLNRPLANIGVATGAPGPDVLDVDVKVDGNGWAAFNRAKREGLTGGWHRAVRTRNGGLHLFF